ncbi:MAG: hypothetical protein ACYCPO_04970 [Acidobacteriaceae bacterium]
MIDLEAQQELGRAKNTIQDYFIRKLLVPKIYLDADWNGEHLDVLAIDRAGVGDVHTVRITPIRFDDGPSSWQENVTKATLIVSQLAGKIKLLPGHFRYIALLHEGSDLRKFEPADKLVQKLTAADGVGRIGILAVNFADNECSVRVILKAERFRSTPQITEMADQYVAGHTANWEVRE